MQKGLNTFLGNNSDLVAGTLPRANMVNVLNYKTQEFVTSVDMLEPRGILPGLTTSSRPGMIVSRAQNKDLPKIAPTPPTDTPLVTEQNAIFGGNGSHVARIYI